MILPVEDQGKQDDADFEDPGEGDQFHVSAVSDQPDAEDQAGPEESNFTRFSAGELDAAHACRIKMAELSVAEEGDGIDNTAEVRDDDPDLLCGEIKLQVQFNKLRSED